jgi:hypothetical protein
VAGTPGRAIRPSGGVQGQARWASPTRVVVLEKLQEKWGQLDRKRHAGKELLQAILQLSMRYRVCLRVASSADDVVVRVITVVRADSCGPTGARCFDRAVLVFLICGHGPELPPSLLAAAGQHLVIISCTAEGDEAPEARRQ